MFIVVIVISMAMIQETSALSCHAGRAGCFASCQVQNCATGYCFPANKPASQQTCTCSRCGSGSTFTAVPTGLKPRPTGIRPTGPRPTGPDGPIVSRPTGPDGPIVSRPTGPNGPIVTRPTGPNGPIVTRPTGPTGPFGPFRP